MIQLFIVGLCASIIAGLAIGALTESPVAAFIAAMAGGILASLVYAEAFGIVIQ